MLPQRRGGTQCSGCCAGPLGPGVFAPSQGRYDRRPKSKLPAPGLACDADPPARRSLAQRRLPWAVRDCSLAHRVTVSLPQARGCPQAGRWHPSLATCPGAPELLLARRATRRLPPPPSAIPLTTPAPREGSACLQRRTAHAPEGSQGPPQVPGRPEGQDLCPRTCGPTWHASFSLSSPQRRASPEGPFLMADQDEGPLLHMHVKALSGGLRFATER